jgi:hypothetical protein
LLRDHLALLEVADLPDGDPLAFEVGQDPSPVVVALGEARPRAVRCTRWPARRTAMSANRWSLVTPG